MQMIKCSNCGKENREDARFCDQCGYPLQKEEDTATRILKIILGILGGVVLAVILLLVSMTLIGMLLYFFILLMARANNPTVFAIILTIIFMIPVFLSIPYWKKVFTLRLHQKNSVAFVFRYALKWFLKGPFAYKDLK